MKDSHVLHFPACHVRDCPLYSTAFIQKSDTPLPNVSPYVFVLKLLGRNADGLTFNCNPRYLVGLDSPFLLNLLFQQFFIQQHP